MSISYEETGRRNQKARTRAALVAAARELLAEGRTPTVELAAARAAISRATAYRYFANQRMLLVAAHPEVEERSLLGSDPPADPEDRLDAVVRRLAEILLSAEDTYRTMLRVSLDPSATDADLSLRQGLRLVWIEDALEPVRDVLSASEHRRLVHALAATVGIEALVALIDLAGLSRHEAVEVVRWSARGLLRFALAESDGSRA